MCDGDEEAMGALGMTAMTAMPATVLEPGCVSCENEWLVRSKDTEEAEMLRLAEVRKTNLSQFVREIYDYAQHMNDTQRQARGNTLGRTIKAWVW
eukprot:5959078-Pleurochrysis_carterae.AAC.1